MYNIRQKVDCDSEWVIYLITCKKCAGHYVGKSKTEYKFRHSNHKQEIIKKMREQFWQNQLFVENGFKNHCYRSQLSNYCYIAKLSSSR